MLAHAEHSSFGVGEGAGERGLGEEEEGAAGERLVVFLPWMDFPGGGEGALPPPLLSRSSCASPVHLLGASD